MRTQGAQVRAWQSSQHRQAWLETHGGNNVSAVNTCGAAPSMEGDHHMLYEGDLGQPCAHILSERSRRVACVGRNQAWIGFVILVGVLMSANRRAARSTERACICSSGAQHAPRLHLPTCLWHSAKHAQAQLASCGAARSAPNWRVCSVPYGSWLPFSPAHALASGQQLRADMSKAQVAAARAPLSHLLAQQVQHQWHHGQASSAPSTCPALRCPRPTQGGGGAFYANWLSRSMPGSASSSVLNSRKCVGRCASW